MKGLNALHRELDGATGVFTGLVPFITLGLIACGATPISVTTDADVPLIIRAQAVGWNAPPLREVDNPSGDIYTYAPSVIVDGATEHIWSCHNKDSGVVKDYIYYTKRVNGSVLSSVPVLFPSVSGWDSMHTCDPSVLRSNISYNGVQYSYVMFYLGTDSPNWHNQIGVALAQNIEGPWIKSSSPIVAFPFTDTTLWGVGQPSATNVDGNGRMLLFYSEGDTAGRGYRREINIGNLNTPSIGPAVRVTDAGITRGDGFTGQFTSFDVAYNPSRDRFYAVLEQYPFENSAPDFLTSNLQLVSIESSSIWNGGGKWRYEGVLTPALTGFARNHNAGFKRTADGTLPDPGRVDVMFAKSCANCTNSTSTYDLWEISGNVTDNSVSAPTPSGFYKIVNRLSGKALDVPYESFNQNGAKIQQYAYNNYQQQQWQFTDLQNGYYKITNRLSGKVLDVPYETRNNNGSPIQQWDAGNASQQQWKVEAISNYLKITNRLSGKVLDVPYEGGQNDGTKIQQWTDLGTAQQQWALERVP